MRTARIIPLLLCSLAPCPPALAADHAAHPESRGERVGPPLPEAEPSAPVRERRRWALAGELGYNGLAGVGLNATYRATPHLSLDLGGGLAVLGYKLGARGRYQFLTSRWTPFVGAGFLYGTGTGGHEVELKLHGDKTRVRILPSPFLQGVVGLDYVSERGFTFTAALGWAQLLRQGNVVLVSGPPLRKAERAALAGSGPVVSVAVGRSF
jgi:hypothetical protein